MFKLRSAIALSLIVTHVAACVETADVGGAGQAITAAIDTEPAPGGDGEPADPPPPADADEVSLLKQRQRGLAGPGERAHGGGELRQPRDLEDQPVGERADQDPMALVVPGAEVEGVDGDEAVVVDDQGRPVAGDVVILPDLIGVPRLPEAQQGAQHGVAGRRAVAQGVASATVAMTTPSAAILPSTSARALKRQMPRRSHSFSTMKWI